MEGMAASSSSTPFGVLPSASRRITPPSGLGVLASKPILFRPRVFTAAKWPEMWVAMTGTVVDTLSRSSRVGWRPRRASS